MTKPYWHIYAAEPHAPAKPQCALYYIDHHGDELLGPFLDKGINMFISTADPVDQAVAEFVGMDIVDFTRMGIRMGAAETRVYLHALCSKLNAAGFAPVIDTDE